MSGIKKLEAENRRIAAMYDAEKSRALLAEDERDKLLRLKVDIGIALGGMDDSRPFVELAREIRIDRDKARAEVERLTKRLNKNRCNSGHETLPVYLWDCPVCVQEKLDKLKAEGRGEVAS